MQRPVDPHAELLKYLAGYPTQQKAADALDISLTYLSDLIHERRGFSDKVLDKLGMSRVVVKQ